MKKFVVRFSVVFLLAAFVHSAGYAFEGTGSLASEEAFLASFGDRAIFVAPGVYEVRLNSKESMRVAFGDAGRQYDRTHFESQLDKLQAELAATTHPSHEQLEKLHRLEALIAGLQTPPTRAAVTGWTCPGAVIQYSYSLDGYLSAGLVTAKARIGLGIDFGPAPPSYPNRYANAYATAYRGKLCQEISVSTSDSVTNGALGFADTTASVICSTGTCVAWETFSTATQAGCADGYRSLYRWGGSLANCP
ncbi:MAG TPA: hypothetical protein VN851_14500 [Thermoanaerobaculia bacterium]|nr:hypothetical protein [Thermoanaerobaculia bacterium]